MAECMCVHTLHNSHPTRRSSGMAQPMKKLALAMATKLNVSVHKHIHTWHTATQLACDHVHIGNVLCSAV
jgi:hypothetical protein